MFLSIKNRFLFIFLLCFWLQGCSQFERSVMEGRVEPPSDLDEKIKVTPLSETDREAKPLPTVKEEEKPASALIKTGGKKRPKKTIPATDRFKESQLEIPFTAGDKVILNLTWWGISAGDVSLEVLPQVKINEKLAYHFKGTAVSSPLFSVVYRVDDWIESYVDAQNLFPYKTALHGNETDRIREGLTLFDYEKKKVFYWNKRIHSKKGVKEERKEDPLVPGLTDPLTAAFLLRSQKFELGKSYTTPIYAQGKMWTVKVTVIRREMLSTPIADYDTWVLKPETYFEGALQQKGESFIWITADKRKQVVKFESKIKIGALVGYLKELKP